MGGAGVEREIRFNAGWCMSSVPGAQHYHHTPTSASEKMTSTDALSAHVMLHTNGVDACMSAHR